MAAVSVVCMCSIWSRYFNMALSNLNGAKIFLSDVNAASSVGGVAGE